MNKAILYRTTEALMLWVLVNVMANFFFVISGLAAYKYSPYRFGFRMEAVWLPLFMLIASSAAVIPLIPILIWIRKLKKKRLAGAAALLLLSIAGSLILMLMLNVKSRDIVFILMSLSPYIISAPIAFIIVLKFDASQPCRTSRIFLSGNFNSCIKPITIWKPIKQR